MRCPNCGEDIPENYKFCGNCGTRVNDNATRLYDTETDSYRERGKLDALYTEIYDTLYQQTQKMIKEIRDRRKKISLPNSSFIISVHPKEPTTKSIFLSGEEWSYEKKDELEDIDDDLWYCEKTLSEIKSIILALRAEDRKCYQSKFTSLEQSFKELENRKNEFVRSMRNLEDHYPAFESYDYRYDDLDDLHEKLGAAQDICEEYDTECKRDMIDFFDKALEILYSITKNQF